MQKSQESNVGKAAKSEKQIENNIKKDLTNDNKSDIIVEHEKNGVWHSLVVRLVRDQEAAGSNPVTPTIKKNHLQK